MWSNPHMLIMDEPTNYLDRESLGALALAIKEWSGEILGTGRIGDRAMLWDGRD
jgi:ATPase subunit of ABC transporter with duplicated ATPase domains